MGKPIERVSRRYKPDTSVFCLKYLNGVDEVEYPEPVEMQLLNISRHGLGIVSDKEYENGALLLLDIKLDEEHFEKVSARIMWQTSIGGMIRYGLSISNMSGRLFTYLDALDNSVNTQV